MTPTGARREFHFDFTTGEESQDLCRCFRNNRCLSNTSSCSRTHR